LGPWAIKQGSAMAENTYHGINDGGYAAS
jgi:hypothetical protein